MSDSEVVTAVPVRKHFAVWYGAVWYGPAFDDIYDCPVATRDPAQFSLPEEADYFRLYDRLELEWQAQNGLILTLRSDGFDYSPFYVPGGRLLKGIEKEKVLRRQHYGGAAANYTVFNTRFRKEVVMVGDQPVEIISLACEAVGS